MQLGQPLNERQADAESALRPHQRPIRLRENLEDARQHLRHDADSVVLDRHNQATVLPLGTQPDATAVLVYLAALLRRLANTRANRTGSTSRWIGSGGRVTVSSWPPASINRTACLQGGFHQRGQFDPLLAELQHVAGDAGHVEQVFQQPRYLLHLAVDYDSGPLQFRIGRAFGHEDLQGVTDRGQRVTQLVG